MKKSVMPLAAIMPASHRYRARAEECRVHALSFRDDNARTEMLHLAADYERKAIQAEAFELVKLEIHSDEQHAGSDS